MGFSSGILWIVNVIENIRRGLNNKYTNRKITLKKMSIIIIVVIIMIINIIFIFSFFRVGKLQRVRKSSSKTFKAYRYHTNALKVYPPEQRFVGTRSL